MRVGLQSLRLRGGKAYKHMVQKVLFLSNGHGEDLINSQVIQAFTQSCPEVEVSAMPTVGAGNAYRRLGVPIIGPTSPMPSGGVFYMKPLFLVKDIWAGLIGLTWKQLRAVWAYSGSCDLILATGDIVVAAIAHSTRRPYAVFLSAYSSYYEGRLRLGFILPHLLNSPRCLAVFTRDAFTARDLNQQGLSKAKFVGTPVMDSLIPTGKDLQLISGTPTIALLPGSRLPEASNNLRLQLQLVREIAGVMRPNTVQFRAALVSDLMAELEGIAAPEGWQHQAGKLTFTENVSGKLETVEVLCYSDAFADILQKCDLVIGMSGTAVEQAVGLGKPAISIPGPGPSFTYRFAEAQMRLLGPSVQTIGTKPATPATLGEAAYRIRQILQDSAYLEACAKNGLERMGEAGASLKISKFISDYLRTKR
jgi:uncharacterized protein (TIGR03492 family)